ncbi:hypothetical protein PA7_48090 [Pseudonocardia asaccharolytica DSM 44247 = NBRC 16224]|uniref:Uncharacterized protein n=1 Tax=Pseudonocardia asaccharolytica DSM 44247 = NBRC 16224 TaxID=1123024 RepID=A0A511D872_9PSEU|nr:hypothetical protein PA7_48090 [Pseudonocardia asaccharolytica DSM 44247 = NBRC 16224]
MQPKAVDVRRSRWASRSLRKRDEQVCDEIQPRWAMGMRGLEREHWSLGVLHRLEAVHPLPAGAVAQLLDREVPYVPGVPAVREQTLPLLGVGYRRNRTSAPSHGPPTVSRREAAPVRRPPTRVVSWRNSDDE